MKARTTSMLTTPTISTVGNPQNPVELAMKLIEYYNEANWSQSNSFFGNVKCLAAAIKEFQHSPDRLSEKIRQDLTVVFSRHFDQPDFTVSSSDNGNGTYDLTITGSYYSDGKKYDLSEKYSKQI